MKLKTCIFPLLCSIFLFFIVEANGEEKTEIYIPLGQSPGVSGTQKSIEGYILDNTLKNHLTISSNPCNEEQKWTVTISIENLDLRSIYIDKSKIKESNTYGTLEDLKICKHIELYKIIEENGVRIKWIKIEF